MDNNDVPKRWPGRDLVHVPCGVSSSPETCYSGSRSCPAFSKARDTINERIIGNRRRFFDPSRQSSSQGNSQRSLLHRITPRHVPTLGDALDAAGREAPPHHSNSKRTVWAERGDRRKSTDSDQAWNGERVITPPVRPSSPRASPVAPSTPFSPSAPPSSPHDASSPRYPLSHVSPPRSRANSLDTSGSGSAHDE
jgi:hypothetical protein